MSTERQSEQDAKRLIEETLSEVRILRQLAGHPSISMFFNNLLWFRICLVYKKINKKKTFFLKVFYEEFLFNINIQFVDFYQNYI